MKWFLIGASVLLAGCAETGGGAFGRPGSPVWLRTATPEQMAAHFAPACAAYGFQRGTDGFAGCIQDAISETRAANGQSILAAQTAASSTCRMAGGRVCP